MNKEVKRAVKTEQDNVAYRIMLVQTKRVHTPDDYSYRRYIAYGIKPGKG